MLSSHPSSKTAILTVALLGGLRVSFIVYCSENNRNLWNNHWWRPIPTATKARLGLYRLPLETEYLLTTKFIFHEAIIFCRLRPFNNHAASKRHGRQQRISANAKLKLLKSRNTSKLLQFCRDAEDIDLRWRFRTMDSRRNNLWTRPLLN